MTGKQWQAFTAVEAKFNTFRAIQSHNLLHEEPVWHKENVGDRKLFLPNGFSL